EDGVGRVRGSVGVDDGVPPGLVQAALQAEALQQGGQGPGAFLDAAPLAADAGLSQQIEKLLQVFLAMLLHVGQRRLQLLRIHQASPPSTPSTQSRAWARVWLT